VAPRELSERRHQPDLDPELRLISSERQRALLAALAELPEQTRELVWLHYFEGLKYREIADIVDGNPTTVKVQVHRARRELRRSLAKRLDADDLSATMTADAAQRAGRGERRANRSADRPVNQPVDHTENSRTDHSGRSPADPPARSQSKLHRAPPANRSARDPEVPPADRLEARA
jgi:hypothetical protein